MDIRAVRAGEGRLMREVRMRALADSPEAFGGAKTLREESAFDDAYWEQLAREVGGEVEAWRGRCVSFVIEEAGEVWATGSAYLCRKERGRAYFSAAWVDPRQGRKGLGRWLVEEAVKWARERGCDHMRLWVDEENMAAAGFYERLGFLATGERQAVEGAERGEWGFERGI